MPELFHLRSRLPVLLALASVLSILWIGARQHGSLTAAWQIFHIPAEPVSFADSRMVTYPIDCLNEAKDPYDRQACHPMDSVYNYPPLWLDLRYLGITSRSSVAFGLVLAALFVGALVLLLPARNWIAAVVVFAGALSRPALFAVERGNIDLAIFSLMVFSLFLIALLKHRYQPFVTALMVVFLTALKVYPIAAVVVFLRNRRGLWIAALTAALSIAVLLLTAGRSLIRVIANTPQPIAGSYGVLPFSSALVVPILPSSAQAIARHHSIASAVGLIVAGLFAFAGYVYRDNLDRFVPPLDFEGVRGRIAISCLAIFGFTFLAGAAFDYRLIFLLGVLGYLVDDLNRQSSVRSLPACIALLAFLWMPLTKHVAIAQVLDGLGFFAASAWMGSAAISHLSLRDDTPQRLGPSV